MKNDDAPARRRRTRRLSRRSSSRVQVVNVARHRVGRGVAVSDAARLWFERCDGGVVRLCRGEKSPEDRAPALVTGSRFWYRVVVELLVAAGHADERHDTIGPILI